MVVAFEETSSSFETPPRSPPPRTRHKDEPELQQQQKQQQQQQQQNSPATCTVSSTSTCSSRSDKTADAQEVQDLKESAALIDELFYSLSPNVASKCTFHSSSSSFSSSSRRGSGSRSCNSNPKLKEAHIKKVVKYANRRLGKMNWSLLMERRTIKNARQRGDNELLLPVGMKHREVRVGEVLGEGSFSTVYVRKKHPDQVIKLLRKKLMHNPAMLAACAADMVKEGWILSTLAGECENIIQIHGWQENGLHALNSGYHDGFFLLLERLECTLGDKIKEWQKRKSKLANPFSLRRRRRNHNGMSNGECKLELLRERLDVIPQVAKGIGALHKMGILHRDLKPDNIGLGLDGKWKLFDLDVARICPTRKPHHYFDRGFQLTKRVGSPRYMSPECAKGQLYNCQSDVYTFALIVHEVLTLLKPYDEVPSDFHDSQVFYEHYRPAVSDTWPVSMQCLLDSSWHKDWRERPNLTTKAFHSSLVRRILPDFMDYKQERYLFTRHRSVIHKALGLFHTSNGGNAHNSGNNNGQKPRISEIIKPHDDLESSFSTFFTGSFRTDSRDVSPMERNNNTQILSV